MIEVGCRAGIKVHPLATLYTANVTPTLDLPALAVCTVANETPKLDTMLAPIMGDLSLAS